MRNKQLYGWQIWLQMKDGTTSKLFYRKDNVCKEDAFQDWKKLTQAADPTIKYGVIQEVWVDDEKNESYYDLDYYNL